MKLTELRLIYSGEFYTSNQNISPTKKRSKQTHMIWIMLSKLSTECQNVPKSNQGSNDCTKSEKVTVGHQKVLLFCRLYPLSQSFLSRCRLFDMSRYVTPHLSHLLSATTHEYLFARRLMGILKVSLSTVTRS